MTYSLFSTKPGETGFRLHAYEVYNWGTFDKEVWQIEPHGETSLLTGANASGKTTLIDGLLTLLVPEKRMRFYNQTAGAKGERTEESYVVGEYGETENQETQSRETKKLRPDKAKAQSILMAVFRNESHYITLVQARWFAGSELKKVFILAHRQLSITADFSLFDSGGEWRKRLKHKYPKQGSKEVIQFTDSPGEYGRLMRKAFGMRSEKAHTLFSQTIGLKVLGSLDEFVRTQMLEEREAEPEFQKIKDHFRKLSDAHRAIEKANQQIELLVPVREAFNEINTAKDTQAKMMEHQSALPLWFAHTHKNLIATWLETKEIEKNGLQERITGLNQEADTLSGEERDLDMQIKNDETGKQISELEKANRGLQSEKTEREAEINRYNELAQQLELQQNPSSQTLFEEQLLAAGERKKTADATFAENDSEKTSVAIRRNGVQKEFDNLDEQLKTLRSQKNNITGRPAEIRKEIIRFVGATEAEIPFIGELVKVKPEESHWESAIERVLHNFALRLIVPDAYYNQVSRYVNENNLRGRIIYHHFDRKRMSSALDPRMEDNMLYSKLAFKPSDYTEWIKNEISGKFNYLCTDNLDEFRLYDKALTSAGQVKNASRHEKDDRPEVRERQQFILGWDNKEKIALLKAEAEKTDAELKQLDRSIRHLEQQQHAIRKQENLLVQFLLFNSYKKINWWASSKQIQENSEKIETLKKTNDRISALTQQRNQVLAKLKEKKTEIDDAKKKLDKLEIDLESKIEKRSKREETIALYKEQDISEQLSNFEAERMKDVVIDMDTIEATESNLAKKILAEINQLNEQIRTLKSKAEVAMRKFKYPEEKISQQFPDWKSDTHRLSDNADFIQEYVALLDKIEKQELAEHKQQFKKYLNEEMITKMSDFQGWLQRQEEDIEENIETLNASLEKINFKNNPSTFIRLQADKDYSPKVKEFKERLGGWHPNVAEFQRTQDDQILEASFIKIKTLLDELTLDENKRKEVLDVRNWLRFKALEIFREDPSRVFRSYTGTAKLSGGEGAQLTYTILGSSIAYQFGIHNEGLNKDSFRFICVDEAFSKQDDEKARFLMDLCQQLHLQLMVVSPAKAEEVAIVEPYIARVHFVQRKDNKNSVVYDMPIKQLQDQRKEYLEGIQE